MADLLTSADGGLVRAAETLHIGPLTYVMSLLSAWWMKGIVIAALGTAADLRLRPVRIPRTPALAGVALLVAALLSHGAKGFVDRVRPTLTDPALSALVAVPGDASFPSGHATSAFAVAGVVALLHPSLRALVLSLASMIAVSRVYLGVHYPSDVVAGAGLGLAIGVAVVFGARRFGLAPRATTPFTTAGIATKMSS